MRIYRVEYWTGDEGPVAVFIVKAYSRKQAEAKCQAAYPSPEVGMITKCLRFSKDGVCRTYTEE